MDLANLNAFIAIAETGSFSEAGERLHLTQPAVSKRIAGLEQQLGVRLFDRLGREIGLTQAGRALLPRAYQILNVLDDTRRALTNLSGEVSGRLTLATSHHIGLHRLPALLRAFTRAHPQVALDIQFLDSEVAYEEVLHGRAELAVITLAPETREPIRAVAVWDDPLDFVAAPEHPLARSQVISLADVARHPAVFDPLYVNMLKAGEAGGRLEVVLERLAKFEEKSLQLRGKVKAAMVYPLVVMTVAVTILVGLLVFVVPKFQQIFADLLKGAPLPALTQAVLAATRRSRELGV